MSNQFAPEYIRAIAPYQAGKPISEVAREFGLDTEKDHQTGVQRKSVGYAGIGQGRRAESA